MLTEIFSPEVVDGGRIPDEVTKFLGPGFLQHGDAAGAEVLREFGRQVQFFVIRVVVSVAPGGPAAAVGVLDEECVASWKGLIRGGASFAGDDAGKLFHPLQEHGFVLHLEVVAPRGSYVVSHGGLISSLYIRSRPCSAKPRP